MHVCFSGLDWTPNAAQISEQLDIPNARRNAPRISTAEKKIQ